VNNREDDLIDRHSPLREDSEEIAYVQARVIRLVISLFEREFIKDAFTITFSSGNTVQFLKRLITLLKLEILGEELFREIIPSIKRRISFNPERVIEVNRYTSRGRIDWLSTLKYNWQRPPVSALSYFVNVRPLRQFETPENILTVLTIHQVLRDSLNLLRNWELSENLDSKEENILSEIVRGAQNSLKISQFRELEDRARILSLRDDDDPEVLELEFLARERVEQKPRSSRGYQMLLAWREKYFELDLIRLGDMAGSPFRYINENDLYEIFVFLEFVYRLSKYASLSQIKALRRGYYGQEKPLFRAQFPDRDKVDIYFQRSDLPHYFEVGGIPDMVVELVGGNRLILADMKNYSTINYSPALYKMMGYLNNFGYNDGFETVRSGVLFFPIPSERHSGFNFFGGRGQQRLCSLILSPSERDHEANQRNLDEFIRFICEEFGVDIPEGIKRR